MALKMRATQIVKVAKLTKARAKVKRNPHGLLTHKISHNKPGNGYLILETLITIGILAVGLLGVSAMQLNALKSSVIAVQRGEAAILIADMTDRMRANSQGVFFNHYANASSNASWSSAMLVPNDQTTNINSIQLRAQADFNQWINDINASFAGSTRPPAGGASPAPGTITCPTTNNCTIAIKWSAVRSDNAPPASDAEKLIHITSVVF